MMKPIEKAQLIAKATLTHRRDAHVRGCTGKRRLGSESLAQALAASAEATAPKGMKGKRYVYQCQACGAWHITRQRQ